MPKHPKVWIADDDRSIRWVLERALKLAERRLHLGHEPAQEKAGALLQKAETFLHVFGTLGRRVLRGEGRGGERESEKCCGHLFHETQYSG